jgi:hypothetical protein
MSVAQAAKLANNKIYEITKANYFSAIPLDRLYDAVEDAGFSFEAEEKQCLLCGRKGQATWDLFYDGKPAKRRLVVTWHKMETTGRYEVVAYVS